jgi:ubiquinone/menaquinone biosynthesis C-methylase UbiE/class 3 adenylate cyclase
MFTDLVESTAREVRLGTDRADAARREHFEMIGRVIDAHGGRLVKSLGDGVMVVFDTTSTALDCAVVIQQSVDAASRGNPDRVALRIGLSTGEVVVDGADCFGIPVIEAARLCAQAGPREILCAAVIRALVRTPKHPLRPVGARDLKGIPEPVDVFAVEWQPLVDRGVAADFADLDNSPESGRAVRMLDRIGALGFIADIRERILARVQPAVGERILDVGSGTGDDVIVLAGLVGATGAVVGVDKSAVMVDEARQRAAALLQARFVIGDAERLDLGDDSFDAVRSDRLVQYVLDPVRAVREMVRVTRPGGRVVVAETDWETAVFDAPDDEVARRINHAWCDSRPSGQVGHKLFGIFKRSGLDNVDVTAYANVVTDPGPHYTEGVIPALAAQAVDSGAATPAEASQWVTAMKDAVERGVFFRAFTTFVVAGRVPGAS